MRTATPISARATQGQGAAGSIISASGTAIFCTTSHQVTNVLIEIDGDRAGSESYVFRHLARA